MKTPARARELALHLALAALLGENVYSFGELLAHPVLGHLRGKGERIDDAVVVVVASGSGGAPWGNVYSFGGSSCAGAPQR